MSNLKWVSFEDFETSAENKFAAYREYIADFIEDQMNGAFHDLEGLSPKELFAIACGYKLVLGDCLLRMEEYIINEPVDIESNTIRVIRTLPELPHMSHPDLSNGGTVEDFVDDFQVKINALENDHKADKIISSLERAIYEHNNGLQHSGRLSDLENILLTYHHARAMETFIGYAEFTELKPYKRVLKDYPFIADEILISAWS